MRLSSWKSWGFGLAMVSLAGLGMASAQTLAGVTTTLDQTLESKSAAVGTPITATLKGSVKAGGLDLPKGTQLIGRIAEVKAAQKGSPASVSVVFATAKLKNGKEVPVKATVIAAYPRSADQGGEDGGITMGAPPQQVPLDGVYDQEPGALSRVSLKSAVKSSDSATFASNENFKLPSGTLLQLGVGAAGTAAQNAAE
ncbi:MAG TPA: hypothetical protein VHX13_01480 [Acidobacteriaceae bacterium]|jgi:hypothetical protein|nr:hypothetical protein [Acidobacteriaceae bacterium]